MSNRSFTTWLRDKMNSVIFRITLGLVDIAFMGTRIKQCRSISAIDEIGGSVEWRLAISISETQWVRDRQRAEPIGLIPGQGWEDKLQKQFEEMAREEFGIEIDDKVFLG